MNTLLHIDSSPRDENRSQSKKLGRYFREIWFETYPQDQLIHRDLYITTPPHVSVPWIEGAYSPVEQHSPRQKQGLEISDLLIDEFISADVYLLGVPLYNFGMPSVMKAYIDNIVRLNRTFSFDPKNKAEPYQSLVPPGKKMFVIVAAGDSGFQEGEPNYGMNHLEPHIRTVFRFIGIDDFHFIYCGNDEYGGEKLEHSISEAIEQIEHVVGLEVNGYV